MLKIIPLALLQSAFQVSCQLLMKVALKQIGDFSWSFSCFVRFLTSLPMIGSGLCFAATAVCWLHILKHFPFSVAYPMSGLAYVMGMFAAMFFFGEQIPLSRWIGVAFIILGCYFIAK